MPNCCAALSFFFELAGTDIARVSLAQSRRPERFTWGDSQKTKRFKDAPILPGDQLPHEKNDGSLEINIAVRSTPASSRSLGHVKIWEGLALPGSVPTDGFTLPC